MIFSPFAGGGKKRTARLLMFGALFCFAAGAYSPRAEACMNSERAAAFFEFPNGSAVLPEGAAEAFRLDLRSRLADGRYVDSYQILASGDLAEGAEWAQAPAEARLADRRLGEARAEAIRALIGAGPPELRSTAITVTIRENRQVFTPDQIKGDPRLNERLRAGVAADIRERMELPKGSPVPVC